MDFSVLTVFLCLMHVCLCQNVNEEIQGETSDLTVSEVCAICDCNNLHVDCSSRDLPRIFQDEDWNGLNSTETLDIDFSGNPLKLLDMVPDLPIYKLNLSRCHLDEVVDGPFTNLEELESLDLSYNQLSTTAIKKVFIAIFTPGQRRPTFANMHNLILAYNDIHALPKDVFVAMSNLRVLDLSGNPLTFIDQVTTVALSDLKLTDLNLASCDLESLPEGLLRRQRRLQNLDLSSNRFTTIPSVLSEAAALVSLDFDKNYLTNLTERTALSNLTTLQELRICRQSKLQSISARSLGGLESLKTLYITNNPRLNFIDPGFLVWEDEHDNEQTPILEEFYLNNNNISSISSEFLDTWNQLKRADFSNNPYVCDCTNRWMVDVLVPLLSKMDGVTAANMICKRPADFRGLSFETLRETNRTLDCSAVEVANEIKGPDMAILLGVMIGIFVTFPIVLIVVLLWKNGFFERWRRIKTEPDSYYNEDDAF